MIFDDEQKIKETVEVLTGRKIHGRVQIVTDTTDYMRVMGGMILRLGSNDYFITGDATEGRFGIDDQPKTWVKYAYDLEDGARKIIKLVFYEDFTSREGKFLIKGTRSPEKEAKCLEAVKDDPRFMQGFSIRDPAGNLVRVLDFIRGKSLYVHLHQIDLDHEQYFHQVFPAYFEQAIGSIEGLKFLEQNGLHHGDVRNDHILIDKDTGAFKWIDFDFSVSYEDYDIWSCGNIIAYLAAKRIISFKEVSNHPERFPHRRECTLTNEDGLLFYKYRIANLKKLYPYIPDRLNNILMRFSQETYFFYEEWNDLINDLREAQTYLPKPSREATEG